MRDDTAASSELPGSEGRSHSLARSAPEEQGISSSAVLDFIDAADREIDGIHSFMLVRHRRVVAEGWWSPHTPGGVHRLYSLSKSFTSSAIGLLVAEGLVSLDDPVLRFFPENAPPRPSDNLRAMRVRDLLSMSTGQSAEDVAPLSALSQDHLTTGFFALPVGHKPGTLFVYNTPATYILSALVQKVTGMTMLDFLRPRLFSPLGIEHPRWPASSEGITLGGIGLSLRTEDVARFGQLYLDQGCWNGHTLIPASWVAAATARQASNGSNPDSDWEQGYGYQFWRSRHGAYRGDGAYGQFCLVMPRQDAVVAITSGTRDLQRVMNLVWSKLLPAMGEGALPPAPSSVDALERRLAALTLHAPQGAPTSEVAEQVSGKTYVFGANPQNIDEVTLHFHPGGARLQVESLGRPHRIESGYGAWKEARTAFVGGADPWLADPVLQPAAARGAWTSADAYTMKLALHETPLAITLTFRFAGSRLLVLQIDHSVEFGSSKSALLLGDAR